MSRKFLLLLFILHASSFNIIPIKSDLIITSSLPNNHFASKSRSIRNADKNDDLDYSDSIDNNNTQTPKIYSMKIESNVTNRYAQTLITSKVRNDAELPRETVFAVILPDKAFVSKFVMTINGRDYIAYVKEKEEAKQIYEHARERGEAAAHVASRDSNRFTVSVNIEALTKVIFSLTYEQLLERKNNMYELVININPRQPVKELVVDVEIQESLPLRMVRVPPIRSGNEVIESDEDLDPRAKIERINETCAKINFNPNVHRQKELAKLMKFPVKTGLSGQFIVQYDVERTQNGGEVLLEDGYFIHFFAPPDMESLRKNVIFVLDTSGSMHGTKIQQLKSAMSKILNELHARDKFALVEFNTKVHLLNLENTPITYSGTDLSNLSLPRSNDAIQANIKAAESIISRLEPTSLTNIYDALMLALHLVNQVEGDPNEPQPIIVFLTDGDATAGKTDDNEIIEDITKNNKYQTPIYCLSFGRDAQKNLLQKISLKNNGFSRHIYEGGDAVIQLQDFYRSISSPIMNNITFKYVEDVKDVTKTIFPIMFNGSEIVITGRIDKNFETLPKITALCAKGPIDFVPEIKKPIAKLERMWAYLTVQELLQAKEVSKNNTEQIRNKALDIALKYNFVTPVSSMVVVKPNSTNSIDLEDAGGDEPTNNNFLVGGFSARMQPLSRSGYRLLHNKYAAKTRVFSSMSYQTPISRNFMPLSGYADYDSEPISSLTTISFLGNIDELKTKMPWINKALQNNMLLTDKGSYKIDVSALSPNGVLCPVTPTNGTGHCKYIHECPDMFQYLTSIHIFGKYQCDLNGYAAICCPPPKTN